MRPYQHARSSARAVRPWTDDLPVHEFMDATKFACADRRHRVVLHHVDLGGEIASRAFPQRDDVRALVRSHVVEDLSHAATLADWFAIADVERLPRPVHRRVASGAAGVAALIGSKLPLAARPFVEPVCAFLFLPCTHLHEAPERALPLLMNCAGPMIVRRVFGAPTELPDGTIIDHGWIAEAAIYTAFGRVPDLGEVVRCWSGEPVGEKS